MERMACYRELFKAGLGDWDVRDVRRAVAFSVPLGDNQFKERIEATLGRSTGYAGLGRFKQDS
jgi:hypothetical protein